jgi:hypothetical protein
MRREYQIDTLFFEGFIDAAYPAIRYFSKDFWKLRIMRYVPWYRGYKRLRFPASAPEGLGSGAGSRQGRLKIPASGPQCLGKAQGDQGLGKRRR